MSYLDTDQQTFDPHTYLHHYFQTIDHESEILLHFLSGVAHNHVFNGATVLDIGCGPTIYATISAARSCSTIHMSDVLAENLDEIGLWLNGEPRAFDWTPFIRRALELEAELEQERAVGEPYQRASTEQIAARASVIRGRITALLPGDVRQSSPLGDIGDGAYDIVMALFCLEAAVSTTEEWQQVVANVATLVKPKGVLVLAALADSTGYRSGAQRFTIQRITEDTCRAALRSAGFDEATIHIEHVGASTPDANVYQGALLCTVQKR